MKVPETITTCLIKINFVKNKNIMIQQNILENLIPHFKKTFDIDMLEKQTNEINLNDIDIEVFKISCN